MISVINLLLPRARAWANKSLNILTAAGDVYDEVVTYVTNVYTSNLPEVTQDLARWEKELGIPGNDAGLTVEQRRTRLAAYQRLDVDQSAAGLQDFLRQVGFTTLFVHKVDASSPPDAAALLTGHTALFNGVTRTNLLSPEIGDGTTEAGGATSELGGLLGFVTVNESFPIPSSGDATKFYLYVGGATLGATADVPAARRAELELTLIRFFPAYAHIGVIVNYV